MANFLQVCVERAEKISSVLIGNAQDAWYIQYREHLRACLYVYGRDSFYDECFSRGRIKSKTSKE
jgi:hypothetical protein